MLSLSLRLVATVFSLALVACGGSDEISVKLYPASLAKDQRAELAPGWRRVEFEGSEHSGAGVYDVAAEPVLTEWSIIALKVASQADGSKAVAVRLSAYGQRKVGEYTTDPANHKSFLALEIDGRWADFSPVLGPVRDRMTLYGFSEEQALRLENNVANR